MKNGANSTSNNNHQNNFYYFVLYKSTPSSVAIISQIRLISTKRLSRKIRIVGKKKFRKLQRKIVGALFE